LFGNSRQIAEAIRDGLQDFLQVELVEVEAAPAQIGATIDRLIVGGATHPLGMSRPETRTEAANQAPVKMPPTTGIREWLTGADGGAPSTPGSRGRANRLRGARRRKTVASARILATDEPGELLRHRDHRAAGRWRDRARPALERRPGRRAPGHFWPTPLRVVGMMHGAGGLDAIWVVAVLVIWAVSIAAAAGIGVMYVRLPQRTSRSMPALPSPLDILERRYATGEIDREEFDDARARLREHEIDL
jgi:uncharacterized membrane protein